ncbi:MAG: flagellin [Clostridium sp.]|nr:flagellin [Clostridium sp.]
MRLCRNMASMRIFNRYSNNLEAQSKTYKHISSGNKINSYRDDPNAKAKSDKLRMEVRSLQMASRNVQDSTSLLQTMDGGMDTISNGLTRIKELMVQAGGANTEEDRKVIQGEIDSMIDHITYTANNTEMNGVKLLSDKNKEGMGIDLLIGATSDDVVQIETHNLTAEGLGLVNKDGTNKISTENTDEALIRIESAVDKLNSARGKYGAVCNRMESTYDTMEDITGKVENAEATIVGADIALEMLQHSKNSILIESGLSMMAQTNKFPQDILQILQNVKAQ